MNPARHSSLITYRLSLIFVVLLVFGQVVNFQLLSWDDDIHLTKNPYLDPVSWSNVGHFWVAPYENLYIPVSYTFYAIEVLIARAIGGADAPLDPRVFHAGNLLLHAICVLLVFNLLVRLVRQPMAAWAGALLFALHPLQVESVAWVGETRGLLSTALALVAINQYLQFAEAATEPTTGFPLSAFRSRHFLLATLTFVLSMLAKPSAVALPLVVAAIDWCWLRRRPLVVLKALAPWLVLAVAVVVITKSQQADVRMAFRPSVIERPLIAGDALTFYLGKLAIPLRLGFDYGRSPQRVLASRGTYYLWIAPVLLLGIVSVSRNRWQWYAAAGIFVAALLPTLGFIPFLYQDYSTVADRYMYLPMLGVSLALAAWLTRHGSLAAIACCGFLLGALGRASVVQARFWQDDLAVYQHGLEVNPRSYAAQYSLGGVYRERGQTHAAESYYRAALRLNPQYARADNDLGAILLTQGRTQEAIEHFRSALKSMPDFSEAHNGLANALVQAGEIPAAIAEYKKALEINPRSAETHLNLGDTLADQEKLTEARPHLERAIELKPKLAAAHFVLGKVFFGQRLYGPAEREWKLALEFDPKLADAHNDLGLIYWREGRIAEAGREFDAAIKDQPDLAEARVNKACVLLEQNQIEAALREFREALRLVPADSPRAKYITDEIRKYEPSSSSSKGSVPKPPATNGR
jgi:tetratricopeptide (TPR) repeat protein